MGPSQGFKPLGGSEVQPLYAIAYTPNNSSYLS
jgi:hypothetical protein